MHRFAQGFISCEQRFSNAARKRKAMHAECKGKPFIGYRTAILHKNAVNIFERNEKWQRKKYHVLSMYGCITLLASMILSTFETQ